MVGRPSSIAARAARPVATTILLIAILAPAPARAQEEAEMESQKERLEALQREIRARRAEAVRLGQREKSVLGDLRHVERELSVTEQLIETLEDEIESNSDRIVGVTGDLARAQDELTVKRQILGRRLRSIYKLGRFGAFEVLLRSDSFAEALSRYKYLRLIAEQDARLLDQIARLEARIRADRNQLEVARNELSESRGERVEQAQSLSAAERARARMLTQVKSQRSEQLKAAEALEAETRRIQQLLVTLERRRAEREAEGRRRAVAAGRAAPEPATSTLTGDFGALDWPVAGQIVGRFGRARHPVYNTEIINNGIDIKAPRGTPIKAVEAGEVAYADWNGGYGLMVILDHDGGYYSLYAHLDRANVGVGDSVERRQAIGTVGESGSLVGPQLHFEIRQGGRAVDPIGWLKGR
jgi:septal ring factor EnvC (AmiA/AmiB activator)